MMVLFVGLEYILLVFKFISKDPEDTKEEEDSSKSGVLPKRLKVLIEDKAPVTDPVTTGPNRRYTAKG